LYPTVKCVTCLLIYRSRLALHYSFDLRFSDVDVAFVLGSFGLGLWVVVSWSWSCGFMSWTWSSGASVLILVFGAGVLDLVLWVHVLVLVFGL